MGPGGLLVIHRDKRAWGSEKTSQGRGHNQHCLANGMWSLAVFLNLFFSSFSSATLCPCPQDFVDFLLLIPTFHKLLLPQIQCIPVYVATNHCNIEAIFTHPPNQRLSYWWRYCLPENVWSRVNFTHLVRCIINFTESQNLRDENNLRSFPFLQKRWQVILSLVLLLLSP